MSIAARVVPFPRSFRSLMFSAAMHLLHIKDLKDLRFFLVEVTIDMQDLKDLKRRFFTGAIAGDRPPRYGPGRDSPRHAPFGSRRARTTEVGPMPYGRRDLLVPIRCASRPGGLSY